MLGVDRQDPRAGRLRELGHELAADDERLLVGQREVDPLAERRDGRAEARRADERVEDEVGPDSMTSRTSPSGPVSTSPSVHASAARAPASTSARAMRSTPVRCGLGDQRLPGALGAQADELEVLGALDDVERLGPDGPGRPEDEEAAGTPPSVEGGPPPAA